MWCALNVVRADMVCTQCGVPRHGVHSMWCALNVVCADMVCTLGGCHLHEALQPQESIRRFVSKAQYHSVRLLMHRPTKQSAPER